MPPLVRSGAVRVSAVTLFLVVLTFAYSWPLPMHASTAVPHDAGDPLLVTWILWWSTHAVPLTARWWNAPAFYPSQGVFAFSENLLGLAPLTAPILWLGKPPLLAYNVAFLASFVLSGLGAYVLGLVLTRQHGAALVAAIAFAFSPYRVSHLNHLQLLSSYWMPAALAMLHLYRRDGRRQWAVLFSAAWLMQALACGYYFFFLSLLTLLWLAWFARGWPLRRLALLAACWATAVLAMVPLLAGYKRIQDAYGFKRVPSEIAYYSADVAGLVTASGESLLWHGLRAIDKPESELFPGVTIALLGLAGAILAVQDRRQAHLSFYCAAAALMWLLALGPAPAWHGSPLGVPGPYAALMVVPGFNGMRVPARLWMVSILCLSAVAALVVSRVRDPRVRAALVACSVAGLLFDGWPARFSLGTDPGMRVTHSAARVRLGLPLQGNETETMYGAIVQGRPVINGYSGYTAPQHRALADLLDRGDPRVLKRLAADGPLEVVVDHHLDPNGRWRRFVEAYPGAHLTDENDAWTAFELPAGPHAPQPVAAARRLTIARVRASTNDKDANAILDGDLETRWHVDGQNGGETITLDLGVVAQPSAVALMLGTYAGQYPRTLEVSTSLDEAAWDVAWSGDTALMTYDAAVRSPREVPVTISLAGKPARYLRFRQIGHDPRRGWTIVEIQVTQ